MFKSSIVFATFYCSKLLKRTQRAAGLARQSCAGDPRATRRAGALVRRGAAHAVGGEVAIVTHRGRLMQQGPETLRASPPRFPGGRGAPPEPARWGASRAPRDREVEWRPPSPGRQSVPGGHEWRAEAVSGHPRLQGCSGRSQQQRQRPRSAAGERGPRRQRVRNSARVRALPRRTCAPARHRCRVPPAVA